MPAVDGAQLLSDAANLEATSPPRRALLLSLCAVTRIQLKLDQDNPSEDEVLAYNLEDATLFSGVQFLAAAERTRLQFTLVDNMTEDAVMTSFFLFVSNGNLEKYEHAWFYLSQCISMAILLGYDRDPSPVPHGMSLTVLNTRRKIFWLLFITERCFKATCDSISKIWRLLTLIIEPMPYNAACLSLYAAVCRRSPKFWIQIIQ
jgi:hypothetical protein